MTNDILEIKSDVKELVRVTHRLEVNCNTNTQVLDAHMKRTAMNESRVEKLEYWLLGILASACLALILKITL